MESGERVLTLSFKSRAGEGALFLYDPAFNARGELFVSLDTSVRSEIQVFDLSGEQVRTIGEKGNGLGQFSYGTYLAFTAGGDLVVVSDHGNKPIQIWREDGTFVRSFDSTGQTYLPKGGVAVGRSLFWTAKATVCTCLTCPGGLCVRLGVRATGRGNSSSRMELHSGPKGSCL